MTMVTRRGALAAMAVGRTARGATPAEQGFRPENEGGCMMVKS
jgi:hypothetical protein